MIAPSTWYFSGFNPLTFTCGEIVLLVTKTHINVQFDFYALFYYNSKQESQMQGGECMTDSQKIMDMTKQNNGIITTAMVVDKGLSRGSLKYLADTGALEKASRGVYTLPEVWEDEFISIQSRFKRGIYSLQTALFLCDLTDRTPARFHMAFPSTYNLSGPKNEGIVCSGSKEPLYSLGVTDLKTPGGNTVRGYCAERSLCDILRPKNHADVQLITEAYKRYAVCKTKNIPLLSEYAARLHVEEKVRSYLEVLL